MVSPSSRQSEMRSRISGKNTADAQRDRQKLGPGDDHLVKLRVLNSYKQIKFYGTGTGTGTRQLNPIRESSVGPSILARALGSGSDDLTKRDSIFPSEFDGEDQ